MRVLFTTPILEHPPAGGPQLRIENSIKALARAAELYIASQVPRAVLGTSGDSFYRSLSKELYYLPSVAGNRYVRRLRKAFGRSKSGEATSSARYILELVDDLHIEAVWFGYGNISFDLISQIKAMRPSLKVVCDTDSVWSRFVLRELPFQADPARRQVIEREGHNKETEERAWVDLCEVTTAVSEVDAIYYRGIAREPRRIQIFSNALDIDDYASLPDPPADLRRPSMYLAGSFGGSDSPMDVACRWVLNEILPRVQESVPDIHFYIVGRNSDASFGSLRDSAVTVKGKLPSVLPYLAHANVALVPLKFESGTRFKILEAGACGTPLVSTTLGAEGLPVQDGEHILLADDPVGFADAIVRVIGDTDFAQRLAMNCRALVRDAYSIDALSREAAQIIRMLSEQPVSSRSTVA